jgi:hypothetical protein
LLCEIGDNFVLFGGYGGKMQGELGWSFKKACFEDKKSMLMGKACLSEGMMGG